MTDKVKVAAVGDLHIRETSGGLYVPLFEEVSRKADLFVICGDLTDEGQLEELDVFLEDIRHCSIPVGVVLGNHDHQSGEVAEFKKRLMARKIAYLEEEPLIKGDVGVTGVKGFGGGFGQYMVAAWGEAAMKNFVYETVNETLRLESLLGKLETKRKVVALHFSPIRETVSTEPAELLPFLGSSRLGEAIDRMGANLVLHGHAHHGKYEGKTPAGIPVYNVSTHVLTTAKITAGYALFEV